MLLCGLTAETSAFVVLTERPTVATAVLMGGYYSEPDAKQRDDERPHHMVFGIDCVEEDFEFSGLQQPIKYLHTVGDDEDESYSSSFAETLSLHLDRSSVKSVVEIGSSVVSLVVSRLGIPQVVALDNDEDRLRILQHTDCFVNSPSPFGSVKTAKLSTESSLPEVAADLVIVTASLNDHLDCIQEALDRKIPIVIATAPSNEDDIRDRYPAGDMAMDGVFVVDPTNVLSWK